MSGVLHGKVTFDARSFLVNGERIWLHAGEIHYFRFPAEHWEEVLRRARAAGLNAISTYVAWNWHEPSEGEVSFSGDRDLGRYLDLIQSLGMYAIVRPGPYVCAEWEGGGLPAWLQAKPGVVARDDEPRFMAAVSRWFSRLLPIIAVRQASRGGPVVLVQSENEYRGGWNASTRRYIRRLSSLLRAAGIDVPIVGCNAHRAEGDQVQIDYSTDPADQILEPDLVVTYNGGPGAEPLRDLRRKQPNAPLLMTEYWAGPQVFWGRQIDAWVAPPEYARSMLEFVSLGCQVVCYMFDGGTNFGFWGGGVATSYQSNYPVREGGTPGEKYYRLKPVNHFVTQFAEELAESDEAPDRLGFTAPATTRLVARSCRAGHLLFVTDPGVRPVTSLVHPAHGRLDVALPASRALVLPLDLEVLPGLTIDRANVGLLGRNRTAGLVVLWGMAGREAAVTVNGRTTRKMLPAGSILEIRARRCRIIVAPEHLAERAWFLPDRVVFGPDLLEEREAGRALYRCSEGTSTVQVASARGTRTIEAPAPAPPPPPPALEAWQRQACPEVDGAGSGWQELAQGPRSHDELDHPLGYLWYRARFEADADRMLPLFLPRVTSRLLVFANGCYCGVAGELARAVEFCNHRHPADAFSQETVQVPVRRGSNTIVFLSDNLGRHFDGLPDFQGLRGDAWLGGERRPLCGGLYGTARPFGPEPVSEQAFQALYSKRYRKPEPLRGVKLSTAIPAHTDAWLALPDNLSDVVVSIDGRHVGAVGGSRQPFAFVRLPADAAGREVTLRLQSLSALEPSSLEGGYLLLLPRSCRLSGWAWKPVGEPPHEALSSEATTAGPGPARAGPLPEPGHSRTESMARPAWLMTSFPGPAAPFPLFLSIGRLHKGQIYVNGHNAGRFWQVGGFSSGNGVQDRYYLPRCWLGKRNTLVVFEEYGLPPDGVALAWGEGPAWTELELHDMRGDARRR